MTDDRRERHVPSLSIVLFASFECRTTVQNIAVVSEWILRNCGLAFNKLNTQAKAYLAAKPRF